MALVKKGAAEGSQPEKRKRERECPDLAAQLCDSDPVARRWAAKDIVGCPDASATLVEQLWREEEHSVREVILTTLTRIGDEYAVSALVQCLRSEDAALRNEAIEAMKLLPLEVAPIMGRLLSDDDPDVRIFAVNILESLRHASVERWLIDVIERDLHVNVCATAVDLLGEVGTPASRGALESLKARFPEEPYIRFAADIALKRICPN
ncbi:HEAT repeat domain-containing protein [Geomonas sp. RF6]|uniref:HEAT repeat domain-containing protein n=1 Tax=Geomonas sp. RF6 TaxID=2897342 RepID=UPI001E2EC306|nr:HEAT repeat domain-containing protein [Geomonas sp. RF6]UFS72541.1 HEAT repeat domain-containing protein [Geomonas sp. RF6]